MRSYMFLLLLTTAYLSAVTAYAEDETLPLIEEQVDEIIILRTVGNQYARVVFIRDNAVLATRLLLDDMIWNVVNSPVVPENAEEAEESANVQPTQQMAKFQLMWQDYSIAERVVEAERFSLVVTEHDPTQADRCGPWWCQFRNMRDLKQP